MTGKYMFLEKIFDLNKSAIIGQSNALMRVFTTSGIQFSMLTYEKVEQVYNVFFVFLLLTITN